MVYLFNKIFCWYSLYCHTKLTSCGIFLRSDLRDSHINPSLTNDVGSCFSSYLKHSLNLFVRSAIENDLEDSRRKSKCKISFLHLTPFCNATEVIAKLDLLKEILVNACYLALFGYLL